MASTNNNSPLASCAKLQSSPKSSSACSKTTSAVTCPTDVLQMTAALQTDVELCKEIFKSIGQSVVPKLSRSRLSTINRKRGSTSTTIGILNTIKSEEKSREEVTILHNILTFVGLHESDDAKHFWSFRKMRLVAELKNTADEVLCSVRHTLTGHLALVKLKKKSNKKCLDSNAEKMLKTEKKCWIKASSCVQVIRFLFHFRTAKFYVFICEHFQGCLLSHLIAEGLLRPSMIMKIVSQVAFAICSVHNLDIIYRGIAPESILVDADGNIRLIEFQFAINRKKSFSASGFLPYMAPEMNSGSHSFEVDYWSLGILMYTMIVRHHPLSIYCWKLGLDPTLDSEYTMMLLKTVPIQLPKNAEPNQLSLLKELLHEEPRLRIGCRRNGFNELMHHPYFESVKWKSYFMADDVKLSVGSETIDDLTVRQQASHTK